VRATFHKHLLCTSILLGATLFTHNACADADADDFQEYRMASNQELDSMRGGFEVDVGGNKILLSLGIDRVTFINGELATASPVSDLHLQLVQNGPNNNFVPPSEISLPTGTVTLIQNSLDNQTIRNVTTINATVAFNDLVRSQTVDSALGQSRANSSP
jgi:hypothetical protein